MDGKYRFLKAFPGFLEQGGDFPQGFGFCNVVADDPIDFFHGQYNFGGVYGTSSFREAANLLTIKSM